MGQLPIVAVLSPPAAASVVSSVKDMAGSSIGTGPMLDAAGLVNRHVAIVRAMQVPVDSMVDPDGDPARTTTEAAIDDPAETAMNAAVLEAHEARIAALRMQIETLRAQRPASGPIADLMIRLHRAEAARRLSALRVQAIAVAAGSGRAGRVAPVLRPERVATPARRRDTSHHGPASIASRRVLHATRVAVRWLPVRPGRVAWQVRSNRRGRDGDRPGAASGSAVWAGPTPAAFGHVATGSPMTVARLTIAGLPASRAGSARPIRSRLAAARRSLAVARHALTAGADGARAKSGPATTIAGLWTWEGSEHWTLPPGTLRPADAG